MSTPTVLAVISNYARPGNIPQVIRAVRAQSVPCRVVVVDNAPPETALHTGGRMPREIDDYYRIRENAGPPARFAPAFIRHDHQYVWFLDDDLVPGPQAVEFCVRTARHPKIGNRFATIGQIGRRFWYRKHKDEGERWRYRCRNVSRMNLNPNPVDMTCRTHFVRGDLMHHVLRFKWEMLATFGGDEGLEGDRRGWWREDDLLLCLGIQRATGWGSYLLPKGPAEGQMKRHELPAPAAHSARPDHGLDRRRFINLAANPRLRPPWESLWGVEHRRILGRTNHDPRMEEERHGEHDDQERRAVA